MSLNNYVIARCGSTSHFSWPVQYFHFHINTETYLKSEYSLRDVCTYSKAKITYVKMFFIYHDYTARMQVQK